MYLRVLSVLFQDNSSLNHHCRNRRLDLADVTKNSDRGLSVRRGG